MEPALLPDVRRMSFICDTDHMNIRKIAMRTMPSSTFRASTPQSFGTKPPRKLGSSRNRPTGSAMPMTVDRPRIILFSFSEPNFASSHFSNLDGSSSMLSSSKNSAE